MVAPCRSFPFHLNPEMQMNNKACTSGRIATRVVCVNNQQKIVMCWDGAHTQMHCVADMAGKRPEIAFQTASYASFITRGSAWHRT